jgi:hypothetical protein
LLLTKIIGNCHSDNDLLLRSSTISEMVMKIDKLVRSCNKLDKSMGKMVNKQQLTEFGQVVIVLVAKYLPNPELLRIFADEMTEAIKMAGSSPEKSESVGISGRVDAVSIIMSASYSPRSV